ncbi:MAG: hypothetical protein IJA82_04165 [Clostridia bacterium]|nr:hypothetical protein [Clostridia bacterium]
MDKIKRKLNHLIKHFKFKKEELGEIEKMYRCEFFDPNDKAYQRLLEISKSLCDEFNQSNGKMGKDPSIFKILSTYFKKLHILDLLFPIHGTLSSVGENLSVVIGLADFNGCGFTNRRVEFSKFSLVECENYTIFATKIQVGSDKPIEKDGKIRLTRVHIGSDTWICAGVKIEGDVSIGNNTVLGAGAHACESIEDNALAVGKPAKVIKKIDKSQSIISTKQDKIGKHEDLRKTLKDLGYGNLPSSYIRLYEGKPFNSTGIRLGLMYIYTHRLCAEINSPSTTKERQEEILNILFPNHGQNLQVGKDLFVDMLGLTKVGNNVKIGDSVYFSGPVTIEDNVTVGNNTLLYATGHSLVAKERRVGFSLDHLMYEYSISGPILIKENSIVGNECVVVQNSTVNGTIPDNSIYVKSKIL